MQIRTKLTLQFLLIGGIIMIVVSAAVYLFSADFIRGDFYNLLRSRTLSTAKLVLDSYEHSSDRLLRGPAGYPSKLPEEKIIILNMNDDTLYISDRSWNITDITHVSELVKSKKEVFFRQDDYSVIATPLVTGYYSFVVVGAAINRDGRQHLKKLMVILLLVCLTSLILFAIAGWFYSGRALKPISDMVEKVETISISSLNMRIPEGNGTDEIGRLAITFNSMLERLEKGVTIQKDFIANASHELRTPLTSINGQIEVLLMKDRTTDEYKSVLNSVLDDIKSLIGLTNSLLLIARTSGENPAVFNNKIRADEILWQVRDEIKELKNEYHINISMDDSLTDSDQIIIKGDENLLKIAFSNIIDNACKYSRDHTVNIILKSNENRIEIAFSDNGIGISPEEIQKVMRPFYRATNAISLPGTGIGLNVVNQIISQHHGRISIESQTGKGTIVTVVLPASA